MGLLYYFTIFEFYLLIVALFYLPTFCGSSIHIKFRDSRTVDLYSDSSPIVEVCPIFRFFVHIFPQLLDKQNIQGLNHILTKKFTIYIEKLKLLNENNK